MATTGELNTLSELQRAWYRLLSLTSADDTLVENGETAGDVALLCLTRGFRATQQWVISEGGGHLWRKRSTALSWSGTDAADGGRYATLPTDFLRLDGDDRGRSALVQANGDGWGEEVTADEDEAKGNGYYVRTGQLWLTRTASPPSPLYLRYYYQHPAISSATTTFDMPVDARWLCVAKAALFGTLEGWGVEGATARVATAMKGAEEEAKRVIRQTRVPRRMQGAVAYGTHW